jgi:uncharacterized protein
MKILVAGGTGFIGPSLIAEFIAQGHAVVVLTRDSAAAGNALPAGVTMLEWDGRTVGTWGRVMGNVDAVVNLSGSSIAGGRWTTARKEIIRDSRVAPTRALVDAIRISDPRPRVLINLSAVGFYGARGGGLVTEGTPAGDDFLGTVCQVWENEARRAGSLGVRVVLPRLGVVLARGGGVLERMLIPFRMYVGGKLGSGRQWYPWIHRDDVINAVRFVLDDPDIHGPVNMVSPGLVRMEEFAVALGKVLGRPAWFPVPSVILKVLLGEMSGMILNGREVVPERLQQAGFTFRYPDLPAALHSILH